jgi:hypothetical protein
MVGAILFVRNSEWLNGTIPGLCIAFAGSNTDIQPNDLLPILPQTHEHSECKRNCAKKRNIQKLAKKMVRIQSTRNGYFGGYINKRQLVGALGTKKCVDKMYTLRERNRGKSEKDKLRSVTGRMITDIEMNGTIRGAVEVFNLASNLREGDALFSEFIRTFPTRDLDARAWLHRLALEVQAIETAVSISLVPTTTRPHVRTARSTPPYPEVYGFRPQTSPWHLLCPYEFMIEWKCEALVAPYLYERDGIDARTEWTSAGKNAYAIFQVEERKRRLGRTTVQVVLRPGVHYTVVPSQKDPPAYFPFPDIPKLQAFRSAWVLVRNHRPHVPVVEGAPVPSSERLTDDGAKYCNIFFRPWTLLEGSPAVPELRLLGTPPGLLRGAYANVPTVVRRRLRGRQRLPLTSTFEAGDALQWRAAWDEYIHGTPGTDKVLTGNVPSEHARRLIQTFVTNTLGRTEKEDDNDHEADASDADPEIPSLNLTVEEAKKVLQFAVAKDLHGSGDEQEPDGQTKALGKKGVRTNDARKRNYDATNRRSAELWQRESRHNVAG